MCKERREVRVGDTVADSLNHVLVMTADDVILKINTDYRHESSRLNGSDICKTNGK